MTIQTYQVAFVNGKLCPSPFKTHAIPGVLSLGDCLFVDSTFARVDFIRANEAENLIGLTKITKTFKLPTSLVSAQVKKPKKTTAKLQVVFCSTQGEFYECREQQDLLYRAGQQIKIRHQAQAHAKLYNVTQIVWKPLEQSSDLVVYVIVDSINSPSRSAMLPAARVSESEYGDAYEVFGREERSDSVSSDSGSPNASDRFSAALYSVRPPPRLAMLPLSPVSPPGNRSASAIPSPRAAWPESLSGAHSAALDRSDTDGSGTPVYQKMFDGPLSKLTQKLAHVLAAGATYNAAIQSTCKQILLEIESNQLEDVRRSLQSALQTISEILQSRPNRPLASLHQRPVVILPPTPPRFAPPPQLEEPIYAEPVRSEMRTPSPVYYTVNAPGSPRGADISRGPGSAFHSPVRPI